jgi:thioredoxin-dependent peroxiredoxin
MIAILFASLVLGSALKVGDLAPDFVAQDTEGNTIELSVLLERGPVVLTFYPKAFTSGCTRQMEGFGELQREFAELKAQIIAISADGVETRQKFRKSVGAKFPFIADPAGKIINLYDIKTPMFTYAKRRTFVIGKDRVIRSLEEGGDVMDVASTANIVRRTCGG